MPSSLGISVIIPVFNGENFLASTIESVLANCKGANFEVIVVNDGSSDSTAQILKRFESKIKVINQLNLGEAMAVNAGLNNASLPLTLILSHDDPSPKKELFQIAANMFIQNPALVCVYPDWTIIDSEGKQVNEIVTREFSRQTLIGEFLCIPGPGSIFLTEAGKKIGGRDGKWRFVSDYDFWLRLSNLGEFERIPMNLAYWRGHENSASIKHRSSTMANERINVIKEFISANPKYKKFQKTSISLAYFSAARICFFAKGIPVRRYLLFSFLSSPKIFLSQKNSHTLFILFSPISNFFMNFKTRVTSKKSGMNSENE